MNWNIEILTDWEEIWSESFQKEWLQLLDASPDTHVFYHPALLRAWVDTYLPIRQLKLVFVKAQWEEVKVIFPLVHWTKNWKNAFLRVIVPMGYSDYDYHDPIFSKKVSEELIQSFYRSLFAVLRNKYSFDEIILDGLHTEYIPADFNVVLKEPCPYIQISSFSNADEYLNSLSKSFKKNYLRRKQNLEAEANIHYFVCDTTESFDEVSYLFPIMMSRHAERWPDAYKAPKFHENLIKYGLNSGILLFYAITDEKDLVSTRITFFYKKRLYLYMPTINMKYKSFSPGRTSLMYCIEDAYKRDVELVDQLRGAELYKSEWTSDYEMIYNVCYQQQGRSSRLKRYLLSLRKKIAK